MCAHVDSRYVVVVASECDVSDKYGGLFIDTRLRRAQEADHHHHHHDADEVMAEAMQFTQAQRGA